MKKFLIVLAVLLALILAAGAAGWFVMNHYLNKINRVEEVDTVPAVDEDFETDEDTGLDVLEPEDVTWGDDGSLFSDDNLLNILLVGQDRRPGEGRQRSDAMIVCSVNPENGKVSMISFLRDLYVQIPGYTDNRLNAAYAFGGFPLLKSALNANFGITIDGCFEVDFNGFITLIDQIGGVDIELTQGEVNRIGRGTHVGMNHLTGEMALIYARIRKIGTDFGRTNRQRTVLMATYEKMKDKSLSEILKLLDAALPYLTTDMSNADIYATVVKLFPLLKNASVNSYYIPPDGMYSNVYIRRMAVLYPDLPAIRRVLAEEYLPF